MNLQVNLFTNISCSVGYIKWSAQLTLYYVSVKVKVCPDDSGFGEVSVTLLSGGNISHHCALNHSQIKEVNH